MEKGRIFRKDFQNIASTQGSWCFLLFQHMSEKSKSFRTLSPSCTAGLHLSTTCIYKVTFVAFVTTSSSQRVPCPVIFTAPDGTACVPQPSRTLLGIHWNVILGHSHCGPKKNVWHHGTMAPWHITSLRARSSPA